MAQSHGTSSSAKHCSARRRHATPVIAALFAGALLSARAWADPPDAQFSAVASGSPGETIRTPGAVSGVIIGDFPDSGGTDSASTTTDLTAHAKGAASSRGSAGGQATINYYGEVVGPSTSPVPLSIVGSLSTQFAGGGGAATSGGGAIASMAWGIVEGFDMFGPGAGGATACSSPTPCGSASLSVNAVFEVDVGQIFEVALDAQASATNGALAVASVDPEISILPDFLAANPGLSLEFSANITQPGSVGSVPEPSTWTLLALGFAGLAFASRRRLPQARKGGDLIA
jgi:PEP-CTERM motif